MGYEQLSGAEKGGTAHRRQFAVQSSSSTESCQSGEAIVRRRGAYAGRGEPAERCPSVGAWNRMRVRVRVRNRVRGRVRVRDIRVRVRVWDRVRGRVSMKVSVSVKVRVRVRVGMSVRVRLQVRVGVRVRVRVGFSAYRVMAWLIGFSVWGWGFG